MRALRRNGFAIFIIVFFAAFFVIENVNGRFELNDFWVLQTASHRLLTGGHVYHEAFGLSSGNYKYSPMAALLFAPLGVMPYALAKIAYYGCMVALFLSLFSQLRTILAADDFADKMTPAAFPQSVLWWSFLIVLVHIYREFHLGNINVLLLYVYIVSLTLLLRGQGAMAGLVMGVGLLFKPHFVCLLPWLVLRRQYRAIIAALAAFLVGLFLPALWVGWSYNLILLRQWAESMMGHNTNLLGGQQNIFYIAHFYFWRHLFADDSTWLIATFLALMALGFWVYIAYHRKMEHARGDAPAIRRRNLTAECFAILALIPSITVTDTEHFLWSLPLIAWLILALKARPELRQPILIVAFCLAVVLYGGNYHDLLGHQVSRWVDQHSLLGIGNLLFLSLFIYLSSRPKLTLNTDRPC